MKRKVLSTNGEGRNVKREAGSEKWEEGKSMMF
jgi:hypothetical protein